MLPVAHVLVVLVALLHLSFLVLEMFLWTRPAGLKVFRNTPEKAAATRVLAANQGLYNGFSRRACSTPSPRARASSRCSSSPAW